MVFPTSMLESEHILESELYLQELTLHMICWEAMLTPPFGSFQHSLLICPAIMQKQDVVLICIRISQAGNTESKN